MFIKDLNFIDTKFFINEELSINVKEAHKKYRLIHGSQLEKMSKDDKEIFCKDDEYSFEFSHALNIYFLWYYSQLGIYYPFYQFYYEPLSDIVHRNKVNDFSLLFLYNLGALSEIFKSSLPTVHTLVVDDRKISLFLNGIYTVLSNSYKNFFDLMNEDNDELRISSKKNNFNHGKYITLAGDILSAQYTLKSDIDNKIFNEGKNDLKDWISKKDIMAPLRYQKFVDIELEDLEGQKSLILKNFENLNYVLNLNSK